MHQRTWKRQRTRRRQCRQTAGRPESPGQPDLAGAKPEGQKDLSVAEIAAAVRDLASSAERYHERAQQREGVIDYLRSELDVLRRGERRGLLRPLLADMCRLRNDLLRQASGLPADYDAKKAAELLFPMRKASRSPWRAMASSPTRPTRATLSMPACTAASEARRTRIPSFPGGSPTCGATATWTLRRIAP